MAVADPLAYRGLLAAVLHQAIRECRKPSQVYVYAVYGMRRAGAGMDTQAHDWIGRFLFPVHERLAFVSSGWCAYLCECIDLDRRHVEEILLGEWDRRSLERWPALAGRGPASKEVQ